MDKEELKHNNEKVLDLIHQVVIETGRIDQKQFLDNEQMKERIYSQLQEIGQASYIIDNELKAKEEANLTDDIYAKLANLRNARYNQELERSSDASVWNIIRNDLPIFEDQLVEKMRG